VVGDRDRSALIAIRARDAIIPCATGLPVKLSCLPCYASSSSIRICPASFDDRLRIRIKNPVLMQSLLAAIDGVSYGRRPSEGVASYREMPCAELADSVDRSRVHFLGKLPYASYRTVLQVSSLHIYLTYPFVLSWSVLEAMAVDGVAQLRFRIGGLAGLPRAAEAIAAAR
jgi:hypothetical protein